MQIDKFVNKLILVNMNTLPLLRELSELPARLEALLEMTVQESKPNSFANGEWDAGLIAGDWRFLVEAKTQGSPLAVRSAIAHIQSAGHSMGHRDLPLVVVPYMGQLGAEACRAAGISWLDLSGNAWIKGPGLRIRMEGMPNRYQKPGRSANIFAPQASRLARWMLMNPGQAFNQQELRDQIHLDPGYLSRLIKRLCEEGLLLKEASGKIRVDQPDLLLQAWRDGYHIQEDERILGHIPARSGEHALEQVVRRLEAGPFVYAVTGLAAAWIHTQFAGFRLVSLYMDPKPGLDLEKLLGFEKTGRGANLWIIRPKDDGVFQGQTRVNQTTVVHPLQAYMDLKDHPERAAEAADNLREHFLSWGSNVKET